MIFFNDELILCEECSKLADDVETSIAKHLNEFKPVVNARRWKSNKKNKNPKNHVYINFHYRINGAFQLNLHLNHVQFYLYIFECCSLIRPFSKKRILRNVVFINKFVWILSYKKDTYHSI